MGGCGGRTRSLPRVCRSDLSPVKCTVVVVQAGGRALSTKSLHLLGADPATLQHCSTDPRLQQQMVWGAGQPPVWPGINYPLQVVRL